MAIKIEGLSKKYHLRQPIVNKNGETVDELLALNNLSFEVKKGESIGIMGPNGSGKSTLLKILAGITKPSSGRVTIEGKIASILDVGAGFHPELTGRENVFLNGQIHGFSKNEIKNKFDEIVAFSGISNFIEEPIKNYSNGMYLRLAFSIIVHLDFDIYLFDEVISVGDAEFIYKTKSKFQELLTSDKTMLFVSHNMNELSSQNKYMLLENGEIKEFTDKLEVFSHYLEKSVPKELGEIATKNTTVTDFSRFENSSDELKAIQVELHQDKSDHFRTDEAFVFKIKFDKLYDTDTFEPVISITDIQGNIIASTTPVIAGCQSYSEKGVYEYVCVLPAYMLGFQVYGVSIYFIKNSSAFISDLGEQLVEKDETLIGKAILKMENIFMFKPEFKMKNADLDASNLKLHGGFLPAFEWRVQLENK